VFWHLGRDNILPLSYVDNCAEAIVLAGRTDRAIGQIYNVHDDDLPTCKEYLDLYKKHVRPLRTISLPYIATLAMTKFYEKYHPYFFGTVAAGYTPYITRTYWQGNRFNNSKIKDLGWRQLVSTEEGLRRTFEYVKSRSLSSCLPFVGVALVLLS
jgi:nucleoside-diphosphate-sugar epimerase